MMYSPLARCGTLLVIAFLSLALAGFSFTPAEDVEGLTSELNPIVEPVMSFTSVHMSFYTGRLDSDPEPVLPSTYSTDHDTLNRNCKTEKLSDFGLVGATCWAYCMNSGLPGPVCSASSSDPDKISCTNGNAATGSSAKCCQEPAWHDWWEDCTQVECTAGGGGNCTPQECPPPQQ